MTQEEWDRLLIESFYLRPNVSVYRLMGVNYSQITLSILKRFPKNEYQCHMTVCLFVCGHLPKLADVLWKRSKKDIDVIAKVVSKSNIDVTDIKKSVKRKKAAESDSKSYENRKYKSLMTSMAIHRDKFDKINGHNWNTVK